MISFHFTDLKNNRATKLLNGLRDLPASSAIEVGRGYTLLWDKNEQYPVQVHLPGEEKFFFVEDAEDMLGFIRKVHAGPSDQPITGPEVN